MTDRQLVTLRILAQGGRLVDDFDSDRWYLYPVGEEARDLEPADIPPGSALELDPERSTGRTNAYRLSPEGRSLITS